MFRSLPIVLMFHTFLETTLARCKVQVFCMPKLLQSILLWCKKSFCPFTSVTFSVHFPLLLLTFFYLWTNFREVWSSTYLQSRASAKHRTKMWGQQFHKKNFLWFSQFLSLSFTCEPSFHFHSISATTTSTFLYSVQYCLHFSHGYQ
jgi:hypothetical protein